MKEEYVSTCKLAFARQEEQWLTLQFKHVTSVFHLFVCTSVECWALVVDTKYFYVHGIKIVFQWLSGKCRLDMAQCPLDTEGEIFIWQHAVLCICILMLCMPYSNCYCYCCFMVLKYSNWYIPHVFIIPYYIKHS